MEAIECSSSLSVIQRKIPSCSLSIHVWQSKCDKITKFKLKCAKCKLKGANGLNCKLNGAKVQRSWILQNFNIAVLHQSIPEFISTAFAPLNLQV